MRKVEFNCELCGEDAEWGLTTYDGKVVYITECTTDEERFQHTRHICRDCAARLGYISQEQRGQSDPKQIEEKKV